MKYYAITPNKGWILAPKRTWDGKDKNFYLEYLGKQIKYLLLILILEEA